MVDRTYQTIRDEAAATTDPVTLWKLSAEIGAKFKRNDDKMQFVSFMNGGVVDANDWYMNKAPVYRALCMEVSSMVAKALDGMPTEEIVNVVARAA